MKDVFISYKAEEFDDANRVKTTLETNGISCRMAPMSSPGGCRVQFMTTEEYKTTDAKEN